MLTRPDPASNELAALLAELRLLLDRLGKLPLERPATTGCCAACLGVGLAVGQCAECGGSGVAT